MRLPPIIPCAVLIACVSSPAPASVPAAEPHADQRLTAESAVLDYRIGEQVRKGVWRLDPAAAPEERQHRRRPDCHLSRLVGINA
jgi:hypothetical protein